MATACDAQSLVDNTRRLQDIPFGLQGPVIISLLCQIAGMNCDPQSLVNAVPCLFCNLEPGIQNAIIIYLLCNIANNGGGGGGGGSAQLVAYTSGTPAAPADPTKLAIAYDPTGNLPTLGWNTANSTWN